MADNAAVPSEAPAPAKMIQKKGKGRKVEGDKLAPKHPPVSTMTNDAIASLNQKRGSSLHAIKKYIAATYKVDVQKLDPHLKRALKKGVESGNLTKPTGKGASGSFKLAVKSKPTKEPAVAEKRKGKVVGPSKLKMQKATKVAQSGTGKKREAPKAERSTRRVKLAKTMEPRSSVKPKGGETEEADASPDPKGFLKLLGVDLVIEEVLQYLSVEDMKALSAVSKDALIAVRKSKTFLKRVQFRICEDSIRSRVLDSCFHSWKNVRFYLDIKDDELIDYFPESSTISQSLGTVQSLSIIVDYSKDVKDSVRCKINEFALKIIQCSKDSLEDLRLGIYRLGLDEIECIKCPNLKRLRVYRGETEVHQVLLQNLPPLEEISVSRISPSALVTGLQGRMSKLRKLDIDICRDSYEGPTPPPTTDWNLVKGLTKLEDVTITLCSEHSKRFVQDIEEILGCIPTETLTKMSFANYSMQEVCFSQKLGEHIGRFSNLTELRLEDLRNFDDYSLQSVIRGCPKLKSLSLQDLLELGDFGLSGVIRSPTADGTNFALEQRGVSLANLKDLVKLTIRDCGNISVPTLLSVIRFEFLTSLDVRALALDFEAQPPRQFLFQILQQNPSLSRIGLLLLSYWDHSDDYCEQYYLLEKEARRLFPRIQDLDFGYVHK